jgi:ZIP family zinc transporter
VIDLIVYYLNRLKKGDDLLKVDHHHPSNRIQEGQALPEQDQNRIDLEKNSPLDTDEDNKIIIPHCVGCSNDPLADLQQLKTLTERQSSLTISNQSVDNDETFYPGGGNVSAKAHDSSPVLYLPDDVHNHEPQMETFTESNVRVIKGSDTLHDDFKMHNRRRLVQTGISVGLAIALHNFPEGFATFFTALEDSRIGVLLAVAIALHNITLGMCVCLPIYYATGQRWKGFLSGVLLGLTQPIAALIGWAVSSGSITDDKNAIMLSFAGGIMVMISLKELLPTAHRYDPNDSVVTYALVCGMGIMALSLVLFNLE